MSKKIVAKPLVKRLQSGLSSTPSPIRLLGKQWDIVKHDLPGQVSEVRVADRSTSIANDISQTQDLNSYYVLNRIRENEEKAIRKSDLPFCITSPDIHEHVARYAARCLDNDLFCDLWIRCKNNQSFRTHRLILASISPFVKELLVDFPLGELCVLELPEYDSATVALLLCLAYNGIIEGTLDDLREAILLAKSLRMKVPVSQEVLASLFDNRPRVHADLLNLWPKATESIKVSRQEASSKKQRRPRAESRTCYVPVSNVNSICGNSDRVCSICQEHCYSEDIASHVRMHDNDPVLRAKRHFFLERLVCASMDPENSMFKCHVCLRHFAHSGNFKQHLVRHERECGSFSALLISKTNDGTYFDLSNE